MIITQFILTLRRSALILKARYQRYITLQLLGVAGLWICALLVTFIDALAQIGGVSTQLARVMLFWLYTASVLYIVARVTLELFDEKVSSLSIWPRVSRKGMWSFALISCVAYVPIMLGWGGVLGAAVVFICITSWLVFLPLAYVRGVYGKKAVQQSIQKILKIGWGYVFLYVLALNAFFYTATFWMPELGTAIAYILIFNPIQVSFIVALEQLADTAQDA